MLGDTHSRPCVCTTSKRTCNSCQGGEATHDAELLGPCLHSLAGRGDAQQAAPLESSLRCSTAPFLLCACSLTPLRGLCPRPLTFFAGASTWPPFSVSSKPSLQAREGKSEMQPAVAHSSPRALHSWVLGAAGITPCPAHCRQPSHLSLDGKHIGFAAARCRRGISSQSFSREMVSSGQTCKPPIKKKNPTNHTSNSFPAAYRQGGHGRFPTQPRLLDEVESTYLGRSKAECSGLREHNIHQHPNFIVLNALHSL